MSNKNKSTRDRAKKESEKTDVEDLSLLPSVINEFNILTVKLNTFHEEISILSKKSPDGPVNKFKLKFINDTLKKINSILGDMYRPFHDFEVFNEDYMPTTSDVILMFSHYLKSMHRFKAAHIFSRVEISKYGSEVDKWYWYTKGEQAIIA